MEDGFVRYQGSVIIKSVKYRIEGRIGYISIDNFDKGTSESLTRQFQKWIMPILKNYP